MNPHSSLATSESGVAASATGREDVTVEDCAFWEEGNNDRDMVESKAPEGTLGACTARPN
jgi:hypothetical protein